MKKAILGSLLAGVIIGVILTVSLLLIALNAVHYGGLPPIVDNHVGANGYIESLSGQATTWMYGSHILRSADGTILYVLQSGSVNLDAYVGRAVCIYGTLIHSGLDSGRPLIEVSAVHEGFSYLY